MEANRAAYEALRVGLRVGMTERAAYNLVKEAVDRVCGDEPHEFIGDFVGGARTGSIEGPPTDYVFKPGDLFTQEDIANGVKPVEVMTGGEGGQKFVVRFRRAQTGVVYELVASTKLDITEAQWKGVADAGNAVVVDTDDTTKDVDDLVTLEVEMSAAYPVRFFKIRTHFPTAGAGNEGP